MQAWKHAFPFRLERAPGRRRGGGHRLSAGQPRTDGAGPRPGRRAGAARVQPRFAGAVAHSAAVADGPVDVPADRRNVAEIPVEIRRAFGLAVEGNAAPCRRIAACRPNRGLRKAQGRSPADEPQLADLMAEFAKFIQPLEKTGLIRPDHVAAELGTTGQIAISEAGGVPGRESGRRAIAVAPGAGRPPARTLGAVSPRCFRSATSSNTG